MSDQKKISLYIVIYDFIHHKTHENIIREEGYAAPKKNILPAWDLEVAAYT